MAMQRVDPVFAALARRRPVLSSAHFVICTLSTAEFEHLRSLQEQALQRTRAGHAATSAPTQSRLQPAGPDGGELADVKFGSKPGGKPGGKNAETRSICLGFSVPKRQLARAVDRNSVRRVAREAWRHAGWVSGQMPAAAMIKLRRSEPAWRDIGRPALKKLWREELDQLLARLTRRLSQPGDHSQQGHQADQAVQGRPAKPT